MPTASEWSAWSFRALGDRLQFAVDGQTLVEAQDSEIASGSVGARVWKSSLCLDSIRVRKFSLPEPRVVLQPQKE